MIAVGARRALLCGVWLAAAGCSDLGGGDPFEPGPDAGPPEPRTELLFAGTYQTTQHWDLAGAFTDDEGLGGVVADMVVNAVVELAGVPSSLRGEARDVVAGAIRVRVRDHVNDVVPGDLVPHSPLLTALASIFGDVEVGSALGLMLDGADPNRLSGTEKIEAIRLSYEGTPYDVPLTALLDGIDATSIEADFSGAVSSATTLSIGRHTLMIRAGTIVELAGVELLGRDDLAALTDQALAAIVCADLVALIVDGQPSYGISVGGESFSVSAADLIDGCNDIEMDLGDYVVGYFDRDSHVSVGGAVFMIDGDEDDRVDELAGTAGYVGEIDVIQDVLILDFPVDFAAAR